MPYLCMKCTLEVIHGSITSRYTREMQSKVLANDATILQRTEPEERTYDINK